MSIGYACLNIGTPDTNIRSVMQRNATPEKLTEVTAHNLAALEKMIDYNRTTKRTDEKNTFSRRYNSDPIFWNMDSIYTNRLVENL